jgi:hypothetical protein
VVAEPEEAKPSDSAGSERELVAAALGPGRRHRDNLRQLRRDQIAEHHRRRRDGQAVQEALGAGLVRSAGMDLSDLRRQREQGLAGARTFAEQQRNVIAAQSSAMVERFRALVDAQARGLAGEQRLAPAATGYKLTTVDTAVRMWAGHGSPDPQHQIELQLGPPAPAQNTAKVFMATEASPDLEFHVPGLWFVDLFWLFRVDVPDDVLLNAITFVQASGADVVYASGWVLGDSFSRIQLSTRLDMFAVGPPPLRLVQSLGPAATDDGPDRYVHSDWWDVLGQFDVNPYGYQATLINNSFSPVLAGSTAFFVVTASLDLSADGNAFCVADFLSGDLQINVPDVFVSTFATSPIG